VSDNGIRAVGHFSPCGGITDSARGEDEAWREGGKENGKK